MKGENGWETAAAVVVWGEYGGSWLAVEKKIKGSLAGLWLNERSMSIGAPHIIAWATAKRETFEKGLFQSEVV